MNSNILDFERGNHFISSAISKFDLRHFAVITCTSLIFQYTREPLGECTQRKTHSEKKKKKKSQVGHIVIQLLAQWYL